jgi:hypothetical protein
MSKPYTEADLSAQIIDDRTWRIREISDLRTAIERADVILQKVLLRALVAICYAHWEGYVRFSARKFFEHIALRRFAYEELDRQFLRNYFLPRLASVIGRSSVSERCKLVDEILDSSTLKYSRVNNDLVNTRSNLNFEVFSDICLVCGVEAADFADAASFIDVFLLKRRNSIAHGEDTFVAVEDLASLCDQTITLMRQFGDALENQIYLGRYRAA